MSDQNDPARCNIVCGSGETEVISMIIRAFAAPGEAILMHNPCFPIYRIYSACEGRTSILAPMGQDFDPMLDDYIQLLGKKPRVAFVTNLHNPSGVFLEEDQVRRICDAASKETLVVLDEAYIHYSERTA